MVSAIPLRQEVRIPNLPAGQIVDDKGMPTDEELTFRQALITNLNNIVGNEGIVAPSQTTANIAKIQAQVVLGATEQTLRGGTMIYNSTTGQVRMSVEDPVGSGTFVFKTVTLV